MVANEAAVAAAAADANERIGTLFIPLIRVFVNIFVLELKRHGDERNKVDDEDEDMVVVEGLEVRNFFVLRNTIVNIIFLPIKTQLRYI